MNPLLGVILHAIGGFSSASLYVPIYKVKNWAWETFWIILGFIAWIVMPEIGGWLTTPNPWAIIAACPVKNIFWTYLFGVLWGFGGLTCGLGLRYLGMSLGQSLELGFCSVFGTLIPPIFAGTIKSLFATSSGLTVIAGIAVCLVGIAVCGGAGLLKEFLLSDDEKKKAVSQKEFSFWKGLTVAVIGGVMSSCMAFAFDAGKPIASAAVAAGTRDVFKNMPVLIVALAGGFTTNIGAAIIMHCKNRSFGDYVKAPRSMLASNYLLSMLAGVLWYGQFFFYGMGTTKMGKYDFSSWSLHMSFIIIGSNLWGIALREWKLVNRLTWALLWIGIVLLIASTVLIGWGNHLAAK
jgi:L-rhamnose-H+ transport protein